jgi:hypothetical protein
MAVFIINIFFVKTIFLSQIGSRGIKNCSIFLEVPSIINENSIVEERSYFRFFRKSGDKISLFFYVGLDEAGTGTLAPTFSVTSGEIVGFSGSTSGVGNFRIDFSFTNSSEKRVRNVFYSAAET